MNNCPICNRKLMDNGRSKFNVDHECSNGCYSEQIIVSHESSFRVKIFSEEFVYKGQDKVTQKRIHDKINYWKENERYLLELLSKRE